MLYLALINLAAFLTFGEDKRRARRGAWRISEAALFALCLAGGAAGGLLGMYIFHHKTRKWYFRVGVPVILAVQLVAVCYIL